MVRYLRRLLAVLPCLVACAAWAQTETALIADSADGGGPGGGTFFILVSHNGQATDNDAIRASSQASFGRGAYMRVVGHARQVPAGKATLVLRGTQTHTAPIDTIFRAIFRGGSPEVSGSIEVELKPGASYRVNGVVDTYQREVWLEEVGSKAIVGNKVVAPADPELLKAMEGAQHVCCNLRYEGDWISDSAWPHL
ncbi:MAG: hypothetical protein Q8R98_27975, partial [Rubrivivax sp.]|nr:hypothetical protein [Rubrivivax sp.]